MTALDLRGRSAIVGVAESPLGEVHDLTVLAMHVKLIVSQTK